jgi:hypothetical protein
MAEQMSNNVEGKRKRILTQKAQLLLAENPHQNQISHKDNSISGTPFHSDQEQRNAHRPSANNKGTVSAKEPEQYATNQSHGVKRKQQASKKSRKGLKKPKPTGDANSAIELASTSEDSNKDEESRVSNDGGDDSDNNSNRNEQGSNKEAGERERLSEFIVNTYLSQRRR